jgi:hypothetical protein
VLLLERGKLRLAGTWTELQLLAHSSAAHSRHHTAVIGNTNSAAATTPAAADSSAGDKSSQLQLPGLNNLATANATAGVGPDATTISSPRKSPRGLLAFLQDKESKLERHLTHSRSNSNSEVKSAITATTISVAIPGPVTTVAITPTRTRQSPNQFLLPGSSPGAAPPSLTRSYSRHANVDDNAVSDSPGVTPTAAGGIKTGGAASGGSAAKYLALPNTGAGAGGGLRRTVTGIGSGATLSIPTQLSRSASTVSFGLLRAASQAQLLPGSNMTKVKITVHEDRASGSIGPGVYSGFIRALGGSVFVTFVCLLLLIGQSSLVVCDFWLTIWTDSTEVCICPHTSHRQIHL